MDFELLYRLQEIRSPLLDQPMPAITFLGNGGWFWIASGLLLAVVPSTRKIGFCVLFSLLAGLILGNGIVKNLVARERPCWLDESVSLLIEVPKDYSFPSGHTLASFEAAISILLYRKRLGIAALILACLIGFSRLYLFVHFPTDVLAGAVMGTAIAFAVHWAVERFQSRRNEKKQETGERI